MIVSVHSATSRSSSPELPRSRRLRRWADSWMGVSGFLISWAMRWATSRQAATRWAFRSSVRSSKTTTAPVYSPSGLRGAVAEARSESVAPPRRSWSSCSIARTLARRVLVGEAEVGSAERLLRLAEVVGHAVERLDQEAELVAGPGLHLVGEVARGDLARPLGELGDRARDPAREVEPEPRER